MKLLKVLSLCVAALSAAGVNGLQAAVPCGKNDLVVATTVFTVPDARAYYGQDGSLEGVDVSFWRELARLLNKNIIFKTGLNTEASLFLDQIDSGALDAAAANYSLYGVRLEDFGGLVIDADPSFFWSVQFYQEDCQIPEGYQDPLTVTKTLLANGKKIGSRRGVRTVQYQYLNYVATAPAPIGLGLSQEDATALLNELIVDVSLFSINQRVEGLVNGDYFAIILTNGLPLDGLAFYQAVNPCVSGYNTVPKEIAASAIGSGYVLNRSCCQLMQDLQVALNKMIVDGSWVRLQKEAIDKFNAFFGYTPDDVDNYQTYPYYTTEPLVNYSLTAQPVPGIPTGCNYTQGHLSNQSCTAQQICAQNAQH